jgi:uncharacterized protein YtpQ (UPF0354 family)
MQPDISKAIAYIKLDSGQDDGPAMQLDYQDEPVVKPFGNDLLVAYLVDIGSTFMFVQNRHLIQQDISSEELHRIAIRNLTEFAENNAEVHPHGNIFAVLCGGNFEASLILVDLFWTEWYSHVIENGFAIAIPARDMLAFTDIGSMEGISELHDLCNRIRGQVDHPLTDQLFQRANNSWEPLGG